MPIEFAHNLRIYHQDTDCNGIVYHANYLNYMERARNEWLRKLGYSFVGTRDTLFVICSAELQYLRPAFLDDILNVSAKVIKPGAASLLFEQEVRRETNNELCCVGKIRVACVDNQLKPKPLPKFLLTEFERGN